ncbi:MAG: hypothetical protein ACJ786_16830 [Catenulispora sp.]
MNKIRLDLARLELESFDVPATRRDDGTVHGHEGTHTCYGFTLCCPKTDQLGCSVTGNC